MRAEREPWLVPMRIALFRRLHFSTSGVKVCRSSVHCDFGPYNDAWTQCAQDAEAAL